MIVVDTNVIAYLFLSSSYTSAAERTLLRDATWAAPLLWRSELRNILARYVRQQLLAPDDAVRILGEAQGLMAGQEHDVPSREVLELAIASGCSAYDCELVLLAQSLGVALVTADRKLVTRFPATALALSRFAEG